MRARIWIYFLDPSQDRIERFLNKIDHVHYYESVTTMKARTSSSLTGPWAGPIRAGTCKHVVGVLVLA